jgi:hypothetical protein
MNVERFQWVHFALFVLVSTRLLIMWLLFAVGIFFMRSVYLIGWNRRKSVHCVDLILKITMRKLDFDLFSTCSTYYIHLIILLFIHWNRKKYIITLLNKTLQRAGPCNAYPNTNFWKIHQPNSNLRILTTGSVTI